MANFLTICDEIIYSKYMHVQLTIPNNPTEITYFDIFIDMFDTLIKTKDEQLYPIAYEALKKSINYGLKTNIKYVFQFLFNILRKIVKERKELFYKLLSLSHVINKNKAWIAYQNNVNILMYALEIIIIHNRNVCIMCEKETENACSECKIVKTCSDSCEKKISKYHTNICKKYQLLV